MLREKLFGGLPFLQPGESLLLRFLMIPNLFLLHAEGIEHIRKHQGALIVACNHNNAFESLLVPAFLVYHSAGRKI
ncbi:MAG: 1-acyl-sn-glycerol-3-phosphate acyltransferase, partial [Chlorobium sp.]|nr:1-acyl-sn-glycerol-3-phosphate acyltransferase [Chlorobium sp.]